jgi:hypothetical protein
LTARSRALPGHDSFTRKSGHDAGVGGVGVYVQVVCERAVAAGDGRRSHVIDVDARPGLVDALTMYERRSGLSGARVSAWLAALSGRSSTWMAMLCTRIR